jgi:hypothetical protein
LRSNSNVPTFSPSLATRLDRLERRLGSDAGAGPVGWSRYLLGDEHPLTVRLRQNSGSPELLAELWLDFLLAGLGRDEWDRRDAPLGRRLGHDQPCPDRAGVDTTTLRIELGLLQCKALPGSDEPPEGHFRVLPLDPPGGWSGKRLWELFADLRRRQLVLIDGRRWPTSLEAAYWLCGSSADGFYVIQPPGEGHRIAARSRRGTVRARRFAEPSWKIVGRIEPR